WSHSTEVHGSILRELAPAPQDMFRAMIAARPPRDPHRPAFPGRKDADGAEASQPRYLFPRSPIARPREDHGAGPRSLEEEGPESVRPAVMGSEEDIGFEVRAGCEEA